jgi:hypothetical protein
MMVMSDVMMYRNNHFLNLKEYGFNELAGCHRTGINIAHRNGGVWFLRDKRYTDLDTGQPLSLGKWTTEGRNGSSFKLRKDYLQLLWHLDRW